MYTVPNVCPPTEAFPLLYCKVCLSMRRSVYLPNCAKSNAATLIVFCILLQQRAYQDNSDR